MRIRWLAWGVMMALHFLALWGLPDELAPALAGSVYLPLMPLRALGLPVLSSAQSGGWAGPSVLGWGVVVLVWALIWWGVAALIARVTGARRRAAPSA
ncbi:hypothetical protein [Myxococcus landrumensis]|uniref:Uncharacterized protein n=1 Tax=Myxococcus landrumensis TaxID=2813577 RepID=A0ABX7NFS6_9BACT|nr:hypothetical protein [Myxococcus landrumus]QSQ17667.1 hypothetical protein JY572_17195 [Myxococcus landrumus]